MGKGVLSDIDWDKAPVFLGDSAPSKRAPARVVPEEPPAGTTVSIMEATEILGVTRSGLRHFVRDGKLKFIGKDKNKNILARADVEELAAERGSQRGERQLAGPVKEQRVLEQSRGISTDPRLIEPDARRRAERSEQRAMHAESIAAAAENTRTLEFQLERLYQETRAARKASEATTAAISALNMGALTAGIVAAIVAVLPEDVKDTAKRKLDGLVRPNGPNGEAAVAGAAMAGATPPAGAPVIQNLLGELLNRPPMDGDGMKQATSVLDDYFDTLRRNGAKV